MEMADRPEERAGNRRRVGGGRRREQFVLLVWLLLVLLIYGNFRCVVVQGRSMEPTLASGRMLFVWKMAPRGSLRPGDVIVFQGPDGVEMIKRIACIHRGPADPLPGNYWPHDGSPAPVSLTMLFAPYLAARDMGLIGPPSPDQTIYVVGDNSRDSYDSRDYGPISPAQILGKALL